VKDGTILYVYAVADANRVHVAAKHGAKPDTATFTDLYVTYNRGVVC
jgi:hypothetical protein